MSKRNMLLALAALLIAAGSAYAQNVRFSIPFQFTVGKIVMPAGDYSIKAAGLDPGEVMMRALDRQRPRSSFLNTYYVQSTGVQDKDKLVFHCYSDACFLSQIWTEGDNVGRELIKTGQERQLAKQGPALRMPAVVALKVKP